MISLDQILLLEQRVESAVAKIAQLQAENDALRSKCSELTNALSSKSEQLSTFESDQNKIESGILKALDRLNSIENSVLKATGQAASFSSNTSNNNSNAVQQSQIEPVHQQVNANSAEAQTVHPEQANTFQNEQNFSEPQQQTAVYTNNLEPTQFNTMQPVHQEAQIQQTQTEEIQNQQNFSEQTNSEDENGQFDIF